MQAGDRHRSAGLTNIPPNWAELVALYGTPLAVYNIDYLRNQCRALKKAFDYCSIFYSLKCNYNPALLGVVTSEGLGVDVVSPNELKLCLTCGIPASKIVYVENNMTDDEMIGAVDAGVQLVIGSLSRLEKYSKLYPGTKIGLRINADIGAAQHARAFTAGPDSKFGVHSTQIADAIHIAAGAGVKIALAHQHIGSGWLDDDTFIEAASILINEASNFPDLEVLDFGGGFGVPYEPSDSPISLSKISTAVSALVRRFEREKNRKIRCYIEPGRFIVAESSTLLTTVHTIKSGSDGRTFLGTDSGFNQLLRPALYASHHEIVNLSNLEMGMERYDVCGNICESTDFFGRSVQLGRCKEGDIIAIMNYGAYGAAMASDYNLRPPPAEVFCENGICTLTRRRAGLADMLVTFFQTR
jgi:diaminopimelate decarboxylase